MPGPIYKLEKKVAEGLMTALSKITAALRKMGIPYILAVAWSNDEDKCTLMVHEAPRTDEDGDPWFPNNMLPIALMGRYPRLNEWVDHKLDELFANGIIEGLKSLGMTEEEISGGGGRVHISHDGTIDISPDHIGDSEFMDSICDETSDDLKPFKEFIDGLDGID